MCGEKLKDRLGELVRDFLRLVGGLGFSNGDFP
jgi:hypothetical protein